MGHRIGIGHLEASFLKVIAVIQFRAADEECALGIDDDVHPFGGNEDVTRQWSVDQIHLVLEAGTAATDHGDTKSTIGAPLFGEQRGQAVGGSISDTTEFFVPDFPCHWGGWSSGCGLSIAHGRKAILRV